MLDALGQVLLLGTPSGIPPPVDQVCHVGVAGLGKSVRSVPELLQSVPKNDSAVERPESTTEAGGADGFPETEQWMHGDTLSQPNHGGTRRGAWHKVESPGLSLSPSYR